MTNTKGVLYIVATPIGNLADMSARAKDILLNVHMIASEDTRHSRHLLQHFGIHTPLKSLHEHNEQQRVEEFVTLLQQGEDVALISDAGTPLISDPGCRLVAAAHEHHIKVSPIPGPCSMIAAISGSGFSADRFVFEGFLPQKAVARQQRLTELHHEHRTLLFFEAPHRIVATLTDMVTILGESRHAVIAREMTKVFETIRKAPLNELLTWVQQDTQQQRGEFVIVVEGLADQAIQKESFTLEPEAQRVLQLLLAELPLKQAVNLAVKITGVRKNLLYQAAVGMIL